MFQALIEQALTTIKRLHALVDQGRDSIPEAMKVRYSELEAWDSATHGIVPIVFGADAREVARWQALSERRATLVGEAMRKDIKRGEYLGMIDYFHLAVGLLMEFEAAYQHRQSAPAPALPSTAYPKSARAGQLPAPPQDQRPDRMSQAALDERRQAVRPVNDRWELTISVSDSTYRWLTDMAAAREPGQREDGEAAVRLAATIVERVAANIRRDSRAG